MCICIFSLGITENKLKMERDGLVVTKAGRLMCEYIIHVAALESASEWRKPLKLCLEKVESFKLHSVAFPAVGTGRNFEFNSLITLFAVDLMTLSKHGSPVKLLPEICKYCMQRNPCEWDPPPPHTYFSYILISII